MSAKADTVRFFNRDLSWLEFNRRVLAQATHPEISRHHPLLERLKFLGIFASNLDEFFMKRVGRLRQRLADEADAGPTDLPNTTPDGRTVAQTLAEVRRVVIELQAEQAACWSSALMPELRAEGVLIQSCAELSVAELGAVGAWYRANVFPVLTPLAVDPGHRFPFIRNLSESLGVLVTKRGQGKPMFARVKVPDIMPRVLDIDELLAAATGGPMPVADASPGSPLRLLPLEDLIRHNLGDLFPGLSIEHATAFRVTRAAEADFEDEDEETDDLLEAVESRLRERHFAAPVRLETDAEPHPEIQRVLLEEMGLAPDDAYARGGLLEYADVFQIIAHPRLARRLDLRDEPHRPVVPAALRDRRGARCSDMFARIRERDVLVHHPYESFELSTEDFIEQAAEDPDVLAIKQTLYRTSKDSPFVRALTRAARHGKQVACLVELRARFDEEKNVSFARRLEDAGVHVAYGVVGLKTHCKCSLVIRREPAPDAGPASRQVLRAYAHIGTGNYHPHTAQLYTDLGLLTCRPELTGDVITLFNALTGHSADATYARLLVAPHGMRARFLSLIEAEIDAARRGLPARIIAKMNQLEDRKLTEKLYEASAAGVSVDLIVRGFCCLRPGIRGLSDNIRVISVVGRFLEHSRIFHFANAHADPLDGHWFIGSADWMYRNLSARVEAVAPVDDPAARSRLLEILEVMLQDHRDAWQLTPDGTYAPRRTLARRDPSAANHTAAASSDPSPSKPGRRAGSNPAVDDRELAPRGRADRPKAGKGKAAAGKTAKAHAATLAPDAAATTALTNGRANAADGPARFSGTEDPSSARHTPQVAGTFATLIRRVNARSRREK